jgi:hypothetical protein
MSETMIVMVCAVAGSFCGQLAADLLFPSVTRDEKEAQFAWMMWQEKTNENLRSRIRDLELHSIPDAKREEILKAAWDVGAIQPLDFRNEGKK